MKLARGNFLFLRLCLDLIDRGAIVLKSSGFKVIPVDLNEVSLEESIMYRSLIHLFIKLYVSWHPVFKSNLHVFWQIEPAEGRLLGLNTNKC